MNDPHDNEQDDKAAHARHTGTHQGAIATFYSGGTLDLPTLRKVIDMSSWGNAIVNRTPYDEPDPDYLGKMLVMQTLTAKSADEVLNMNGIKKLQESIPDVPDSSTGVLLINDLYVTGSDFGEGVPTYVIFGGTDIEMQRQVRYSTGATQVQAQFLALLNLGVWPIKCQVKRTSRKDKGGRHLFWVTTPD